MRNYTSEIRSFSTW